MRSVSSLCMSMTSWLRELWHFQLPTGLLDMVRLLEKRIKEFEQRHLSSDYNHEWW